MQVRTAAAGLFLLLVITASGFADLAPPKGYTRVSVGVDLEAKEDIPEYRFFLVSGDIVKEVLVKKGEKTSLGALGGGARYSSGKVVAIPRTTLAAFGEGREGDQLRSLESAVAGDALAGRIELLKHSFAREVTDADARNVPDASYMIEKTSNGLIAVPVKNVTGSNTEKAGVSFSITDVTATSWTTIAAGILMSLAFISLGLWAFLRSIKRHA